MQPAAVAADLAAAPHAQPAVAAPTPSPASKQLLSTSSADTPCDPVGGDDEQREPAAGEQQTLAHPASKQSPLFLACASQHMHAKKDQLICVV